MTYSRRQPTLLARIAVVVLIAPAASHICILDPPQRGALSVITPGDPSCYRRSGPCGGVAQSAPGRAFQAGATTPVRVHQNLNHWVPPTAQRTSGYFTLSLVSTDAAAPLLLDTWSDFPAWDEVAQTNWTREVSVPADAPLGPALLAFEYVSYNADEVDPPTNIDAVFYNCADVVVVAAPKDLQTPTPPSQSAAAHTSTYTCTTPDRWSARGVETTADGAFVFHHLVVDSITQQMYWSRNKSIGSAARDGNALSAVGPADTVTTITNFTAGREYVLSAGGSACAIYGPDAFYKFDFGGPAKGMSFGESIDVAHGTWGFRGAPHANGVTWIAREDPNGGAKHCLPLSRVTPSSSLQWVESVALDTIPASQFSVPAVCGKARAKVEGMRGIPGCGPVVA